ncbi:MAG: single-stranded-DNA-specific exonuclease RecJ [Roseibium sp.]|uniref:single-stranded-DNA-specific exonuclease RecJ n=1 Tax=Roseibium sp. TaxID=1936156 RepID=UPI0032983E63
MTKHQSFKGRDWEQPRPAQADVDALIKEGAPKAVAGVLAVRGFDPKDYEDFKAPKLRNLLPEPFRFKDMEKGVNRIAEAIVKDEKIGIWSDYDVDGATSAGILGWFLRMSGHDRFTVRVPDRIAEGYGPNGKGLREMRDDLGCDVICILDSGTLAFDALAEAKEAGIDIVVIDHHAAEEELPEAVAVINPNRKDEEPGYGHLCAAGMVFIFTIAMARKLRKDGYYTNGTPDLMELLDMVALGTVADVVPLTGLNRAFVHAGLPYLSRRMRPGIAALCLAAGMPPKKPVTSGDCGWVLGPRINAGGRIGESDSGSLMLLEEDKDEAKRLAEHLNKLNGERQEIEAACTEMAMADIGPRENGDRSLVMAVTDSHEGVVGISASRLKDAFDAPSIVLTNTPEGTLKGSARSVKGFDIGHAIISARQAGLIEKGGGHGMAGGLTLTRAQMKPFKEFMDAEIKKTDYWKDGIVTRADFALGMADLTVDLIEGFGGMAPFGTGNPEPLVVLENVEISEIRVLKEKHLKLVLKSRGRKVDGLFWGVAQGAIGTMIREHQGMMVDVLCKAEINEFRGERNPQVIIQDIRVTGSGLL